MDQNSCFCVGCLIILFLYFKELYIIQSKLRGHLITCVNEEWLYVDTKTPVIGSDRPCGYCNKERTKEGYDGCLGELPNVMNACCGHGNDKEAYIQYWDTSDIRGKALRKIQLGE